jgi:anti-anti-sigma factor
MQLTVTRHGAIVAIEPAGSIDARAARDFEQQVLGHLASGTRQLMIDLAKVDLMTGPGIRVLILLAQRLQAAGGALMLCALNEQMRSAFDVAGLSQQFQFAASRTEALARLEAIASGSPAARQASKLSRLAVRLLHDADGLPETPRMADAPAVSEPSDLAQRVAALLAADEPG